MNIKFYKIGAASSSACIAAIIFALSVYLLAVFITASELGKYAPPSIISESISRAVSRDVFSPK